MREPNPGFLQSSGMQVGRSKNRSNPLDKASFSDAGESYNGPLTDHRVKGTC